VLLVLLLEKKGLLLLLLLEVQSNGLLVFLGQLLFNLCTFR
tara:strand:- start:359 stop:481 length:123 start_codon:yes stop_codon:yes gene_type:complete